MVVDRVCLHLIVWDVAKKKGFKLYEKEDDAILPRKGPLFFVNIRIAFPSVEPCILAI